MKKIAHIEDLAPETKTEGSFERQIELVEKAQIDYLMEEAANRTVRKKRKISSSELLHEVINQYRSAQ